MENEKKKNVGAYSYDLLVKNEKIDHSPTEQMQEQLSKYESNLMECFESGKKIYYDRFFIVVLTKKERLMPNVLRHYFFHRSTCPTPEYDQCVYSASAEDNGVKFLWVIPSQHTCFYLREHALDELIIKDHRELITFVLDFFDNTLLRKAQMLNGELIQGTVV